MKYTDEQIKAFGLDRQSIPAHVAIIMYGNGRWAKQRGIPRALGHRAGVTRLKEIIRFSSDIGIRALSLYAFSTENWARPKTEIESLCSLFVEFFNKEFDELNENNVCIRALGDTSKFPAEVDRLIRNANQRTKENTGLKLNIAMNYGSRDEIIRAARLASEDPGGVTPENFEKHLYTAGLPDVDLLIRTGGEERVSNFLLYQISYAEFVFPKTFWPDFTQERYIETLKIFSERSRRFGGLDNQ
ncbi:MAG: di-trans,poly-cis-decaprenylcistransferase [Clostridia bacterium]|nr:di-trans,poly-cis-decaprenylcistransferase [Clostridia bacterium]